ncbi:bifunctional D-glycero-beta-D-manno-heptose-7-phosphate kinase/D-glycero-beta-D-manno-heptose 1-phosphate adenylyltransferase HldE [Hydrogenovibrio sp. 3SP14C1]|uniref:bifunctional D-glycero-beta-D-manno-heptose-7-phosphate kinase/D-glycero-beta-D-manno-heptose 1-phosphate adenylyltransferase HldE n=1 Tax=Hydrogenovibrio sp. 3SP14C1 TaxID=3038774 RepID=UPI002417E81D|nr:bifunctional D-glycero-beta-D-manno-heptose-7-phosphate kinase/D-glycero-beta-D-manno-heptose 1-phosphate adenylyltransferase HldE [Hydrogenovibrio sp. 3SP14C1]MDG4811741.1 bifunctional D-glycero-beta-D-manno-heptose-7-phosphate kinase/D-glycero-beta-D-manno-heptose 1-phosphate adenylyltransferase HldE [Hydrogenovibrio sp. 3SP14C1]
MNMHDFSKTKILVVGDVMLDQYWSGRAGRISPEAPVPVVKVADENVRAGGAANVALNIADLGADVSLLGVIGQDSFGQQLNQVLEQAGVSSDWVYSDSGTICKLRVLSHHQQLIRMDFENAVPKLSAKSLAKLVAEKVAEYDVLVISDYAKGALQYVEEMIKAAKSQNVPVLIDPKGNDFSRYAGATLIKPNQGEFELIVGACEDQDDLIEKAKQLIQDIDIDALLVTRSEHGMALIEKDSGPTILKSRAQEVFDVTGAGDTVIATLATAYGSGLTLPKSVKLANEAASIVVRKVGTSTVSKVELEEQVNASMRHQGYASMSEDEVHSLIQIAQSKGEKVVFTNGCFDLLHSGHVRYLNEASRQGDRLVVAVNSDESVKALKGDSRPIVGLEGRMELLSALSCVDWVVPFSEETPERLICHLEPDVLVKGGDYKPDEIAGAQCVWDKGGEVAVLSFWEGYSTTRMVDKIQEAEMREGVVQ